MIVRLSLADFGNKEIADNLDLKTLQALKVDGEKFRDAKTEPAMFPFYHAVATNANILGSIKCYESANSLTEAGENLAKYSFTKGFMKSITDKMEQKIAALKASGKNEEEIKREFSDFVNKFNFSTYGLDSISGHIISLVESKYSQHLSNASSSEKTATDNFSAQLENKRAQMPTAIQTPTVTQTAPTQPSPTPISEIVQKENMPPPSQQPKLDRRLGQAFIKQFTHHIEQENKQALVKTEPLRAIEHEPQSTNKNRAR